MQRLSICSTKNRPGLQAVFKLLHERTVARFLKNLINAEKNINLCGHYYECAPAICSGDLVNFSIFICGDDVPVLKYPGCLS